MATALQQMHSAAPPAGTAVAQAEGIRIGATVFCRDGRAGSVALVAIKPQTREVTHLVVKKGFLLGEDVVVPMDRVVRMGEDHVDVDMTSAELSEQPRFSEFTDVVPDPTWRGSRPSLPEQAWWFADDGGFLPISDKVVPQGWMVSHGHAGIPAEAAPISRGTRVDGMDGPIGSVDEVLIDPQRRTLSHVVVRPRGLFKRDVLVPIDRVTSIGEGGIWVNVDRHELQQMPKYQLN